MNEKYYLQVAKISTTYKCVYFTQTSNLKPHATFHFNSYALIINANQPGTLSKIYKVLKKFHSINFINKTLK